MKANIIAYLIKNCSNHFGGDDETWLAGYIREVVSHYWHSLDMVIDALISLDDACAFFTAKQRAIVMRDIEKARA